MTTFGPGPGLLVWTRLCFLHSRWFFSLGSPTCSSTSPQHRLGLLDASVPGPTMVPERILHIAGTPNPSKCSMEGIKDQLPRMFAQPRVHYGSNLPGGASRCSPGPKSSQARLARCPAHYPNSCCGLYDDPKAIPGQTHSDRLGQNVPIVY
jgi:hypothetical protein